MEILVEIALYFGIIPTVLLVGYGPILIWLLVQYFLKSYKTVPKYTLISLILVLSVSLLLNLIVLFLYTMTISGI